MKNLAHSASFDSDDKDEPSKPGIKQLAALAGLKPSPIERSRLTCPGSPAFRASAVADKADARDEHTVRPLKAFVLSTDTGHACQACFGLVSCGAAENGSSPEEGRPEPATTDLRWVS